MTHPAAIAVEFDFAAKRERTIPVEEVPAACRGGLGCWIDVDTSAPDSAAAVLRLLGVNEVVVDEVVSRPVDGRHDVYDDCLHVSMTVPRFDNGRVVSQHVDLVLGERFLVVLHRGRFDFLEQVRRNYQQSFLTVAKSLGFLLFELWDQLIDTYRKGIRRLEVDVERTRSRIFGPLDDSFFNDVAGVMHDILEMRQHLLAAREVLHELSVRRSVFVPETTQPYLDNMVGTLERLGSDLTVEREILAETVNLHLGIVGHRTNRVVSRLTVISAIFLPLTFLCGVYGMNFDHLPEIHWRFGYLFFWAVAATITVGLVLLIKTNRWL